MFKIETHFKYIYTIEDLTMIADEFQIACDANDKDKIIQLINQNNEYIKNIKKPPVLEVLHASDEVYADFVKKANIKNKLLELVQEELRTMMIIDKSIHSVSVAFRLVTERDEIIKNNITRDVFPYLAKAYWSRVTIWFKSDADHDKAKIIMNNIKHKYLLNDDEIELYWILNSVF